MTYKINQDVNPMAINSLMLQRYNFNYFSLVEVCLFEYLVIKGKSFGFIQFYHSTATIQNEIGLKRNKLDTILAKFEKLRIIHIEIKGFPLIKHFTINFSEILNLLPRIYLTDIKKSQFTEFNKLFVDFYKPLAETYEEKNNKKNINQNSKISEIDIEKKEEKYFSKKWLLFLEELNETLLECKINFDLNSDQLKYEIELLYVIYCNYESIVIFENIFSYFNDFYEDYYPTLAHFMQIDDITKNKNKYIERKIVEQKNEAEKLLNELNRIFNDRRKINSTKKISYSKTSLVINNIIIERIVDVMKVKSKLEISNAFIAFADAVIKEKIKVDKILPYFFALKNESYDVIDTYLDIFNKNYSIGG